MKATELLDFLTAFYRDKLALRNRHVAAAQLVADYNFNNTYQYVINRDDMHVRWLQDAIVDIGGTPEEQPLPDLKPPGKGKDAQRIRHHRRPRRGGEVRRAWTPAGRRAAKRASPQPAAR